MFLKLIVFLTILSLGASKSVGSEDVVWFPNPNGDGSLIPAKLTPPENSAMELGDPKDIHFLYYHKGMSNPDQPDELFAGSPTSITNFVPGLPLKVLVHGFGGHHTHSFPWELRGEYMKSEAEDYNLILINWSILSDSPDYFTAVPNAFITSTEATTLLKYLVDADLASWENIHLIGYSLGGQLVGQIGHKIKELTGSMVGRITALDPALPLFDVADAVNRTGPEDAVFVDVVHTAANGILGYYDPLGHIDFYPNGGRYQPGCGVDLTGSCGHSRAPAYFTESVLRSPNKFIGTACEDYEKYQAGNCAQNEKLEMGHHATDPGSIKPMKYFLETNSESPFAKE